jgi:uncharacterized protein DUF1508
VDELHGLGALISAHGEIFASHCMGLPSNCRVKHRSLKQRSFIQMRTGSARGATTETELPSCLFAPLNQRRRTWRAKFETFKDARGEYRFHLRAGNGEIVASGEGYQAESIRAWLSRESIAGSNDD